MTAQPLNEYTVNGKQIFNLYGIGNPDAVPPVPLTPLITTVIDPTGFDTNGSASTWADTHSTIFNARALKLPPLSNPEILAVQKAVLVVNNSVIPTASIGIEADNSGLIGTYYGMNLFNDNNTDFGITSTFPYSGSVVFDEEGGTNTTTTAIKQGLITITDPTVPLVTSFNATTLTSGAASATWADIISGSAGSNTLQQVLTAGNTATGATATISLANSGVGYTTNNQLLLENTNVTAGNTTGVPSVEFYKSGRNTALNDVIMSQQFNAKAYTGAKTTFGKIECSVTGASAGTGIDGALDFYTCINGVNQNVLRLNGSDNENNTFRPFDLNGNALKTSLTNLAIDATASTGTGQIIITPKSTSNVNVNGDLLMSTDKTITLNDSSPSVVQTVIGDGKVLINDVTNSLTTFQDQATFGIQNATPTTTLYSINGFACNDSSIQCNSTNGFYMNYGSSTNYTQLDLDSFEMYNTNGTLIDQITMGNNGGGNPVFNLLSTDNTNPSPLIKQFGISNQQLNMTYSDIGAGTNTQLTLTNNTGGSGTLNYTNGIDPSQTLTISSNCTIELSTTQDLKLTGAALQSNTASGNSGEHLRILLNGVYYKIKLEND